MPAAAPAAAIPVVAAVAPTDDDAAVPVFEHHDGEVYHPPVLTHIEAVKPPNAIVKFWRKVGGGSLTLSLAIHAGIIIVGVVGLGVWALYRGLPVDAGHAGQVQSAPLVRPS